MFIQLDFSTTVHIDKIKSWAIAYEHLAGSIIRVVYENDEGKEVTWNHAVSSRKDAEKTLSMYLDLCLQQRKQRNQDLDDIIKYIIAQHYNASKIRMTTEVERLFSRIKNFASFLLDKRMNYDVVRVKTYEHFKPKLSKVEDIVVLEQVDIVPPGFYSSYIYASPANARDSYTFSINTNAADSAAQIQQGYVPARTDLDNMNYLNSYVQEYEERNRNALAAPPNYFSYLTNQSLNVTANDANQNLSNTSLGDALVEMSQRLNREGER